MRSYASLRHARKRKQIIELLGGKCKRCNWTDFRALQIDHVDGNGRNDIKSGGTGYYDRVLKFLLAHPYQTKYQLLCANHNWIKRVENNENPIHGLQVTSTLYPPTTPCVPPIAFAVKSPEQ